MSNRYFKFLFLIAGIILIFNIPIIKSEAQTTITTLTMDKDIQMEIDGVKIIGELDKRIIRFVDIQNPDIFYTKNWNETTIKVLDGAYNVYDLTKLGIDYKDHDNLTPIGQVTVTNGKLDQKPTILNSETTARDIQQMFSNGPNNTWVFTGGSATQGNFRELNGMRNFIGYFEEYIRWVVGSENERTRSRYIINVGYNEQTIENIVSNFDTRIRALDPKAVVYMIGKENYQKGDEGINAFKENLRIFIEKSLTLRNNNSFVIIQTPFAVKNEEDLANAEKYSSVAKEIINREFDEYIERIVVVDHLAQTNNYNFLNDKLNIDDSLNANGHIEIAEQLANATYGSTRYFQVIYDDRYTLAQSSFESFPNEELTDKQRALRNKINAKTSVTWLFMGDSILHGAKWTEGYNSTPQLFEKFIKDDLGRKEDIVINTAISGASTKDTLSNMNQRFSKYNPDVVTVMLGTNDVVLINRQEYKENLESIISEMEQHNATVILCTPIPTLDSKRSGLLPSYVEVVKEVARQYPNVILVDNYSYFDSLLTNYPQFTKVNGYIYPDLVHLSAAGHLIMTQLLIKEMGLANEQSEIYNMFYEMS